MKGGSTAKQKKLADAVTAAKQADESAHQTALQEWEEDQALAARILNGETEAIKEVIAEMQFFTKDDLIRSSVVFEIGEGFLHALPEVHSSDIVPSVRRKQLASGRLFESKMPAGQFNELYQDYVASVALRIAGDLFHIVPLDEIYVACKAEMLNSSTGHQEMTPVLSVMFVRETMKRLNLKSIDPSDSLQNFKHVMKFKKTKGFEQIEPLASPNTPQS